MSERFTPMLRTKVTGPWTLLENLEMDTFFWEAGGGGGLLYIKLVGGYMPL